MHYLFVRKSVVMESFNQRVKRLRQQMGLSQIQLAKLSGLSQTTISNIELGRNRSSRDLIPLAKALDVTPEWLVTGKTGKETKENIVSEFAWVYEHVNEEGKTVLRNIIKVIKTTYFSDMERLKDASIKVNAK